MDKRDLIVDVLKKIAILLELKGENAFKIRAYRTGSEIVETYSGDMQIVMIIKRIAQILWVLLPRYV